MAEYDAKRIILKGDKKRATQTFLERLSTARAALVTELKSWLKSQTGAEVTTVSMSATEHLVTPQAVQAAKIRAALREAAATHLAAGMDPDLSQFSKADRSAIEAAARTQVRATQAAAEASAPQQNQRPTPKPTAR